MSHWVTFDGHGTYSPDGKVDGDASLAQEINVEITALELAYWGTKPDRFSPAYFKFPADIPHQFQPTPGFPYRCYFCHMERGRSPELCNRPRIWRDSYRPDLAGATVSTWTGSVLGAITDATVYRHNFGGRFVALTVQGNNGAVYHGRASWDFGTVVKLRKSK